MDEQRLFLRKKVSLPLPIELLPGKEVWLHDLGEGGLSVSGSSRLEPGTATFFKFQFPDANSVIEASGVVAWCDGCGRVGIRFTRIKPDSSAVLKRWLKSEDPSKQGKEISEPSTGIGWQPPRAHNELAQLRDAVTALNLKGRAALNLIAERMLLLTRASGAAIALRDGEAVICRATVGNAPDVGTQLNLEASVTGECYRTGTIVSITDTDNDPRVDADLCRRLEFRSLLVVPVATPQDVIGVAEVFSPIPGNFEGGDILLLGSVAEIIAEIDRCENDQWLIPAVRLAYDIPALDQISAAKIEERTIEVQTPASEIPAATESGSACQEDKENSQGKIDVAHRTDLPQSGVSENPTQIADTHKALAMDSNWKPRAYALLVAFFALLAIALGDFLDWHVAPRWRKAQFSTNSTPASTNQAAEASLPVTEKVESEALAQRSAPLENAPALKPAAVGPAMLGKTATTETVRAGLRRISAEDVRVEQQVPAASLVPAQESSVGTSGGPSFGMTPEAGATLEHISPAQLTPAKLLHRVEPIFPDFARDAGLEGTILLSAIIGTDGKLRDIKLVSGNRALATEAFRALHDWRYRPYLLNGKPIEAETRIVMNFHH